MESQIIQYILAVILGIISSLLAYLLTKIIELKSKTDLSEYKTLPFYLGFISLICSFVSFLGVIVSVISIWSNGRHLSSGKTKAYFISFILSITALTISSYTTGMKHIYGWYINNQDRYEMFNTMPDDFQLLSVLNLSTTPRDLAWTIPNYWKTIVYANVNDTLAFNVYYHNTSNRDAKNVRVRFNYYQNGDILLCGAALSEEFSNNVVLGYSGVMLLDSFSEGEYYLDFWVAHWYPDQKASINSLPFEQSGVECMNLSGLNIGTIQKGNWEHQGNLVMKFVIHRFQ